MHWTMFLIIVALNTPLYFLITRSLFPSWEDFFQAIGFDSGFVGTVLASENGFESRYIQQVAGSIDETLIDLVKLTAAL